MRLYPEPIVRHKIRAKSKATAEETMPSWAGSWGRYIRGNVVFEHAAQLTRRFLSLTLARSSYNGREPDDDAEMAIKQSKQGTITRHVIYQRASNVIQSSSKAR